MRKFVVVVCVLMLAVSLSVFAQGTGEKSAEFPTKTINLIVPFSAGGGTDAVARALAHSVEKYLGQSVVVVNKTGGSGAVGMTYGATSTPDGYTVTMVPEKSSHSH